MVDFAAFPPEAQAYFDAAQGQVPWEQIFTPDAMVRDVDREIRGRDNIAAWARKEVDGGVYTLLSYQPREGGVWILVEFHPADWHAFLAEYEFTFQDHRVSRAVLSYSPEVEVRWRSIPLPVRRAFETPGTFPNQAPSRVVPRLGGLHLEFQEAGGRQFDFLVQADRWEQVRN